MLPLFFFSLFAIKFLNVTIFLIGMPGSGKTTIGNLLAEKLQIPFYDTDNIISAIEGLTIPEIFDCYGESHFRKAELELISNWKLYNAVIATGGGLPAHDNLMNQLNKLGISIWLKVSSDRLIERLQDEIVSRPLMQNEELSKWVKETLRNRKPYYSQAIIRINANENPETIVNKILSKVYSTSLKK